MSPSVISRGKKAGASKQARGAYMFRFSGRTGRVKKERPWLLVRTGRARGVTRVTRAACCQPTHNHTSVQGISERKRKPSVKLSSSESGKRNSTVAALAGGVKLFSNKTVIVVAVAVAARGGDTC